MTQMIVTLRVAVKQLDVSKTRMALFLASKRSYSGLTTRYTASLMLSKVSHARSFAVVLATVGGRLAYLVGNYRQHISIDFSVPTPWKTCQSDKPIRGCHCAIDVIRMKD
jgi:hypothetical protein